MRVFKVTANVKAKIGAVLSAPATLVVTQLYSWFLQLKICMLTVYFQALFLFGDYFSMTVSGFALSESFAPLGEISPSAVPRVGGTSAIAVLPRGRAEGGGWVSGGQEDSLGECCGCYASDGCSTAGSDHSSTNYSPGCEAFSAGESGREGARLHSSCSLHLRL